MASEGPLTQMARQLKDRNDQFQSSLRDALFKIASDPESALRELTKCEGEMQALERDEQALLRHLGRSGPDISQVHENWNGTRLQVLIAQANAFLLMAQFPQARKAVATAQALVRPGSNDPGKAMLDTLEAQISELQG